MEPATEQFVERMGRHFEADGVPRIGGRLYGYLLLQEEAKTLDQLADELHVSKTSVSTNARLLEQWGLLERVTRPGDRRDFYMASPDQTRTLELRIARVRELGELLREGRHVVPRHKPGVTRRLRRMIDFNEQALERLSDMLDRVRSIRAR